MPSTKSLSPEFLTEELTVRGVTYRIHELSAGEYEDLLKKATSERPTAFGGKEEVTDNTLLLKLMVLKCVDPHLSDRDLASLPYRALRRINHAVNQMHFDDDAEVEKPKADDEASETSDDEQGTDQGNGG